MKKIALIILVAIYLLAVSCSDDSSTNPPPVQETFHFPLAIGNEWEFDFYWLDDSYQESGESQYTEKSTIIKQLVYRGKEAYQLDEEILDMSYLHVDNEAIYGHVEYSQLSSDGKNYFPDEWIKLYSFNENEWQIYKKNVSVIEGDYTAEGLMTATGKKMGKITKEINGKLVDIYEYMTILIAAGTETSGGQTSLNSMKRIQAILG